MRKGRRKSSSRTRAHTPDSGRVETPSPTNVPSCSHALEEDSTQSSEAALARLSTETEFSSSLDNAIRKNQGTLEQEYTRGFPLTKKKQGLAQRLASTVRKGTSTIVELASCASAAPPEADPLPRDVEMRSAPWPGQKRKVGVTSLAQLPTASEDTASGSQDHAKYDAYPPELFAPSNYPSRDSPTRWFETAGPSAETDKELDLSYLQAMNLADEALWPAEDFVICAKCNQFAKDVGGAVLKNCRKHRVCKLCLRKAIGNWGTDEKVLCPMSGCSAAFEECEIDALLVEEINIPPMSHLERTGEGKSADLD